MAISNINLRNAFDFSLDAKDFQKKLWLQLKNNTVSSPLLLEDDDLAYINAAGVSSPIPPRENDDLNC